MIRQIGGKRKGLDSEEVEDKGRNVTAEEQIEYGKTERANAFQNDRLDPPMSVLSTRRRPSNCICRSRSYIHLIKSIPQQTKVLHRKSWFHWIYVSLYTPVRLHKGEWRP